MLYKHSKSKEIIVLKVQEDGNQSLKEHITLRIFDDRKSLRYQIFNPPRAPKFLCVALAKAGSHFSVEILLQEKTVTSNR